MFLCKALYGHLTHDVVRTEDGLHEKPRHLDLEPFLKRAVQGQERFIEPRVEALLEWRGVATRLHRLHLLRHAHSGFCSKLPTMFLQNETRKAS